MPCARWHTPSGSTARLGASLHVKGEISGNEDLHIDGSVEGLVQLEDRKLTVGASAKLTADVVAREVVVYGSVKGNLRARDRIEIKKDGSVVGDLTTARIMIEDGAYFKGSIEIDRNGEAGAELEKPAYAQRSGTVTTPEPQPALLFPGANVNSSTHANSHKLRRTLTLAAPFRRLHGMAEASSRLGADTVGRGTPEPCFSDALRSTGSGAAQQSNVTGRPRGRPRALATRVWALLGAHDINSPGSTEGPAYQRPAVPGSALLETAR